MFCVSRQAGTNTTTPPVSQGWTLQLSRRVSAFTTDIYWKRWGDGDTDDSTPTFTYQTGGASIVAVMEVWRGAKATGDPFSQVSAVSVNGTTNPMPAPLSASAVATGTVSISNWASIDDNTHAAPSRGALGYGGASYNFNNTGSESMAYEADVDSSVLSCTMNQSANAPDSSISMTVVLDGKVPVDDGLTITQFSTASVCRATTNGTGWRSGVHTDPIARSGFIYRYAATIEVDATVRFVCWKRPVALPADWVLVGTHSSPVFADPPGITNWTSDPHFSVTIGTSKLGKPQMWLLAHAAESPMQHWQGTAAGDVACDTWNTGIPTTGMSYPQQMNTADGTSLFSGRAGTAGNDAQQVLYEQNAAETGWTLVTSAIMNFTDGGDDESPYMQRMALDPARDELHVSWVWAKANVTHEYHGILYVKGTRTGVATWIWSAMDGTPITLPVLDTMAPCIVESAGVNTGQGVHNGMSFDPATGYPLIPYRKAHGATAGTGTDFIFATWSGSAWVKTVVALAHPTWNWIDSPPASERGVVRAPDVIKVGGALWYTYTSDIDLSTSGVPCLMRRISTDGGATWSAGARFIDQPFYADSSRYDAVGWHVFGQFSIMLTIADDNGDGVWVLPTQANASIVDVAT